MTVTTLVIAAVAGCGRSDGEVDQSALLDALHSGDRAEIASWVAAPDNDEVTAAARQREYLSDLPEGDLRGLVTRLRESTGELDYGPAVMLVVGEAVLKSIDQNTDAPADATLARLVTAERIRRIVPASVGDRVSIDGSRLRINGEKTKVRIRDGKLLLKE